MTTVSGAARRPEAGEGVSLRPVTASVGDNAARAPLLSFPRRRTLFHAGDPATRVYEVLSGVVALWCVIPDGRRQLVDIIRPGGFVGFSADETHICDAECLSRTVVRSYSHDEILDGSELRARVVADLEAKLEDMYRYATLLGRLNARQRVVTFLLRLAGGDARHAPVKMTLHLTRGQIGDYLGLSMETVCRILADLGRRGLIRVGPRHGDVEILQPDELWTLVEDVWI